MHKDSNTCLLSNQYETVRMHLVCVHGYFWVWTQPMNDEVTWLHRLSLADPMPKMMNDNCVQDCACHSLIMQHLNKLLGDWERFEVK